MASAGLRTVRFKSHVSRITICHHFDCVHSGERYGGEVRENVLHAYAAQVQNSPIQNQPGSNLRLDLYNVYSISSVYYLSLHPLQHPHLLLSFRVPVLTQDWGRIALHSTWKR